MSTHAAVLLTAVYFRAMEPVPPTVDELDAVLELIVAEQGRPEGNVNFLPTEIEGIRGELAAIAQPWSTTTRVVQGPYGDVVGAAFVEWDEDVGRAWIHGPWVRGDDATWDRHAGDLVAATIAQLPNAIWGFEISGDVANLRMARLAEGLGWSATSVNYVLAADATIAASWPADGGKDIRPGQPGDAEDIRRLHAASNLGSYMTADQLVEHAEAGNHVVCVAADSEALVGFAAGQVHADGEGYIDFLFVDPDARGRGLGRRLIMAVVRELLPRSTRGTVTLAVEEGRAPARAVYSALSFRTVTSFVTYRYRRPG
jgi:ribosomal protein S18 acetylase RimI-like enzyme